MNFTKLTIAEIQTELAKTVADVRASFGSMEWRQINWRPTPEAWSVAQCLDHLNQANSHLCRAITSASDPAAPKTVWQRLPVWPGVCGRLLVSTQGPDVGRKYTAPAVATPNASDIDLAVLDRFAEGHAEITRVIRSLNGRDPARIILVSPFVSFISYSVLDALRLIAAHDRRHVEQAKRLLASLPPHPPDPSDPSQKLVRPVIRQTSSR